jgi:hypothetical protein
MRSTNTTSIIRPDLGMAVMEYVDTGLAGLIGLQVMPIFPVSEQSAAFPVIPKEALMKLPDTHRAPRGNYPSSDWTYEEGKYSTSENGWEEYIDDTERKLLDRRSPGLADFVAVKRATNIILKNQEKRIAAKLFNAVNFTAHAVTNEWDDATNATPVADVSTGKLAFRSQCGVLPDALVIAYSTFENIKQCASVKDLLKYTYPGIDLNNLNAQDLARLFGLARVFVGNAMYDSAGKGVAATITDIWSNEYAALVKIGQDLQDVVEPCVGRTFLWTEDSPSNPIVEQYRVEGNRSDAFRVRHNTDECLLKSVDSSGTTVSNIAAACVYLFSNITT